MPSVLIVLSNATTDREEEFNDWYDRIHIPEILALPGFVSAERFKLSPVQLSPEATSPSTFQYLTIYGIEIQPAEAFASLEAAVGTGRMVMSESMDQTKMAVWAFDRVV